jgi:hypothetical protein
MHGRWSKRARKKWSSNNKEMTAVMKALVRMRTTAQGARISSILLFSDNTTTVYDVNRQRACPSLRSPLLRLLRYLEKYRLHLTAQHIPGINNSKADRLSRLSPGGDYGLRPEILKQLQLEWGVRITADLFASEWNAKHERFWTLSYKRNASGKDAFSTPWKPLGLPLLHPPVPLIVKTLQRLRLERMPALLILPFWQQQPWSPLLREMTVKVKDLGDSEEVLEKGKRMVKAEAELPPGHVAAYLVDSTNTQPASTSSTASSTHTPAATLTSEPL